jgi:hypothetical protein
MRRGKPARPPKARPAPAVHSGQPAGVSKTEAIRLLIEEWTQEGRACLPKVLVQELKRRYPSEQWTLPYVYSIKSILKKKRSLQVPPASPAGQSGLPDTPDPAGLVLAVKHLAKQAGGLDRLKRLIEALQSDG